MTSLKINPVVQLNGEINASPSKSYSHRAFIAASVADGISIIKNPLTVGDVKVTINILRKLGIKVLKETETSYIIQREREGYISCKEILNCGNSGTSLRIFAALSLLIKGGCSFKGEFIKRKRPIVPLLEALKNLGADYTLSDELLHIERINSRCQDIKIRGDISSQFITALLITCPLLKCDKKDGVKIKIISPIVSYPYLKITLEILKKFGINILDNVKEEKGGTYHIRLGQKFRPCIFEIPGDFSSAAFLIAATCLTPNNSKTIIKNLDIGNPQGDKKIINILENMGAKIRVNQNDSTVIISGNITKFPLKGLEVDCKDIPDLFPILCVVGTFAKGKTILFNISSLRSKESDRVSTMIRELTKRGAKIEEENNKVVIYESELNGAKIAHEQDHRIAMACTIASLFSKDSSEIDDIEVFNDSYPNFILDLEKLGVKFESVG